MPFNVMLQLCRVTRASKLFQRNFYLPLLRPLSPKDALRRHIITGKHLLGHKVEHYIPVLEEYQARLQRRKYTIKGQGKKRQKKKNSMKYIMPFLDPEMDNHDYVEHVLLRKSKGRGQCYLYYIPEKDCTLVVSHQWERAIRDKDILDIVCAHKSEKILVKMSNGKKVAIPLVTYDGRAPFYRGEGWTRREIEEHHHFGKETMGLAKLFEAKEQGVEEWELEMMRLASKRKVKQRGEGTADWKQMMAATVENMDWDQFEEDSKVIVQEINDLSEEEAIPLAVDDMEKTKNVCEKLKAGGEKVMALLPIMSEIPEIVKIMHEGEMTELSNVSGISVELANGTERFIAGQMVKSEEGEMFMPGQTLESEDGTFEYTPGFTVLMEGEPTLLPGLVMGDDPNKPMFLPGESTITETGELQFIETEDDRPREETPPPPEPEPEPVQEEEEEELEEEEEEEEKPRPPRKKQEFHYEVPKRVIKEPTGPKRREKSRRKAPPPKLDQTGQVRPKSGDDKPKLGLIFDMATVNLEKDVIEQEKERVSNFTEKKSKEEWSIEKRRREIATKAKQLIANKPPPPEYVPLDPVKKSAKLEELEASIKTGDFFMVDHKKYLTKERHRGARSWKEPFQYKNTFDSVGMGSRHLLWKSVW